LGDLTDGDTDAVWRLASAWTAGESDAKSPAFSQTHLLPVGEFPHWRSALEAEGYALTDEIGESASIPFDAVRCLGLAVPSEDACPGFLALLTDDEEPWQQQDIVALQTVAAALSNTSARESLFRQVEATLSETDALYRASSALSEAGTYDAILETLLAHTVLGEGAQRATLELFDQPWADANGSQATGDGMAWVGGTPQDSEIVAYWPMKPGVEVRTRYAGRKFRALLRALEAGTPIFIEDLGRVAMDRARADDGHVLADGPAGPDTLALDRRVLALFRRALGAESAIFVPLAVGGQKIGFLHADYASPQTFSEAARRRLVSLAQQASVAVLNLRQLRQTEARVRREQLIRRITGQIQEAPDVEGVLRTAVRELGRAFGTPRSEIVFHPPATGPAESELPGRGYDGHGADTSEPEATSAGATAGAERRSAAP
jgi:GAF domain-containing protein